MTVKTDLFNLDGTVADLDPNACIVGYAALYLDRGEKESVLIRQIDNFSTTGREVIGVYFDVIGSGKQKKLGESIVRRTISYAMKKFPNLAAYDKIHGMFLVAKNKNHDPRHEHRQGLPRSAYR